MEKLAAEIANGEPVPMPESWGGHRIVPEDIQFWHGRPSRQQSKRQDLTDSRVVMNVSEFERATHRNQDMP